MASADVAVLGRGIAGLTCAVACARRGLAVALVGGEQRAGAASSASAGVLGPSIGRGPKAGPVARFLFAARDRYPALLADLQERTGLAVPTISGALEVAFNQMHLDELTTRARRMDATTTLDAADIAALEPGLAPVAGGVLHERDGAVDVESLLAALSATVTAERRIGLVPTDAIALDATRADGVGLTLTDGSRLAAGRVVIANGAWAAALDGMPRRLPVRPLKGEIAIARGGTLRRVVFGSGGYVVPRGEDLLVGATSEDAGFDATVTDEALAALDGIARALLEGWPSERPTFAARYAGLRPVTPDLLPILGTDPVAPSLLYACGYSRNGILLAPLAAECIAALAAGDAPPFDLTPFRADRFHAVEAPG